MLKYIDRILIDVSAVTNGIVLTETRTSANEPSRAKFLVILLKSVCSTKRQRRLYPPIIIIKQTNKITVVLFVKLNKSFVRYIVNRYQMTNPIKVNEYRRVVFFLIQKYSKAYLTM